MLATTRWIEGLPQPHADLIVGIANSWKTQFDINALNNKGLPPRLCIAKPNLNKWLSYYRHHRKLTDEILALVEEAGTDLNLLPNLYGKEDTLTVENINALIAPYSKATLAQFPDLGESAFPLSMAFNLLVWLPCMFLYGDFPPTLLRKARHGDLDVLCDLIRLDRSVIFDSGISNQLHEWTLHQQEYKLSRVGNAFAMGLKEIPIAKIKIAWAQYAYNTAKRIGLPLTAPQIRALFDAIAQDDGIGPQDPDLAEMTDDAFYQALAKRKKPPTTLLRFRKD